VAGENLEEILRCVVRTGGGLTDLGVRIRGKNPQSADLRLRDRGSRMLGCDLVRGQHARSQRRPLRTLRGGVEADARHTPTVRLRRMRYRRGDGESASGAGVGAAVA